uniref:Uncharacterized protein n=1 Tax=Anguilla anguilla TaxID=7936 RepID=A0A0E9V5W5_ANGAN
MHAATGDAVPKRNVVLCRFPACVHPVFTCLTHPERRRNAFLSVTHYNACTDSYRTTCHERSVINISSRNLL